MAKIIWTEPSLNDLNAIADYIALDKPNATSRFVKKVFSSVAIYLSMFETFWTLSLSTWESYSELCFT